MKCIKCGAENQDGVMTCTSCGNVLNNTNFGVNSAPVLENNINNDVNALQQAQNVPVMNVSVQSNPSVVTNNGMVLGNGINNIESNANVMQPGGNVPNVIETNATILQSVQNSPTVSNNNQINIDSNVQGTALNGTVTGMQPQAVISDGGMQVNSIGSVQPVASQEGNNKPKNNKLKIILIILIVVLVLAIGLAVWVYFEGQEKLKEREEMLENRVEIIWTPNNNSNQYVAGTEVTLVDDSKWYVISQEGDMVTLISSENYGDKTHFSNSVNDYEKSVPKDIIDNQFLPELKNSLVNNNGDVTDLKARIISIGEIREVANIPSTVENSDIELGSSYKWLYSPGSYWTSTQGVDADKPDYTYVYFVTDYVSSGYIEADSASYGVVNGNEFYIRPVIEINKSNIKV